MISVAVGALEGKLEIYLETGSMGAPDPIIIEHTHGGLMRLWGLFQLLGRVPVHYLPEVHDPSLTGLPAGLDVVSLVTAAQVLGGAGWHSCPGGEA